MDSQQNSDNTVITDIPEKNIKTAKKTRAKKSEKKLIAVLYSVNPKTKKRLEVDINDGSIDWGNVKEDRARLYCFYYTLAGSPSYHNSAESYRKTGTKCKDSQVLAVAAFKYRQKHPEITEFINNFEENIIKVNLKEARNAILNMKMKQAFMNPKDFLTTKTITTKDGLDFKVLDQKDIEDISDEDAITYLSGFQAVGKDGRIVYTPIDKQKVQSEILALTSQKSDDDKAEYSTELTIEQIKDKVTAKVKLIKENETQAKEAGIFVDEPDKPIEEA